jgi:hypothetical protein
MSHASTAILITRLEYKGEKQRLPATFWSRIRKYLHISVTEGVVEVKKYFRKLNADSMIFNNRYFVALICPIWNVMRNRIAHINKLAATL